MSIPVRLAEQIPLSLNLGGEEGNLFVEAKLFDQNKDELPESPVNLTHDEDGHYVDLSVPMPMVDYIFVLYRVFNDVGKTMRSQIYPFSYEDVIWRDIAGENTEDLNVPAINKIISAIPSSDVLEADSRGLIVDDEQDMILEMVVEKSDQFIEEKTDDQTVLVNDTRVSVIEEDQEDT